MFSSKKQPPIKSLIAQGTRIDGNLVFVDGLRVDGEVNGDIRADDDAPSMLVISESGRVKGGVQADHVIINGQVTGPIQAFELVELQPKARIQGDVTYKALEMHQGAMISGQLRPILEGEAKPTLKLASNKA
jgi:cytoskeletal protein CcmA (bactofilin family)